MGSVSRGTWAAMALPLLSVVVGISRALGLCNMHYVAERQRFELDNGLILAYRLLLNVLHAVLTPISLASMVFGFFRCGDMDLLSVAFSSVALANALATLVTLASIWLRRRRICRLCNKMLGLLAGLSRYYVNYSFCRRHWLKLLLTSARFAVVIFKLYGPGSALMCGADDEVFTEVPPIYTGLSLVVLFTEALLTYIEIVAYFALATNNRVLECLSKEMADLAQDVRLMPRHPGRHRVVYQRQLLIAWQHLWQRCLRLDGFFKELLKVFEVQMLLNLFTSYLTEIAIFFNLVILIADAEYISLWRYSLYAVLCVAFHLDIMLFFSIFDASQDKWKLLSMQIQELWISLLAIHKHAERDAYRLTLERQVEFAVIFLNWKTQRRPQKVRRLQIMGLFDINRSVWNSMNASIGLNVLILWQLAYKKYY